MVGFIEPNRYQPRAKWRAKLDGWLQFPPPNVGNWQNDITLFWRRTQLEHMSLQDAWANVRMQPNNARSSLDPHSLDIGLIPPDLFSRVLARSRASVIDPNDNVADVIIDPEPTATAPDQDHTQVGFTAPNHYRPRVKWRAKLDNWLQFPPPNVGGWQNDITIYWRRTQLEHMSLQDAWANVRMSPNNARTSLDPTSVDRGLIPPDLFSRVLARSQAQGIDPNDNVADVDIHPEPTS
jgi:hypothetical protein